MAEGPKQFDSSLGDRTAAFIDAVTGMRKSEGDEITPSFDPMDVIPVERAAALAGKGIQGAGHLAMASMAGMRKPAGEAFKLPTKFSVLTADNPAAKVLSHKENLIRQSELIKDLNDRGIAHVPGKGAYGPTPENSILIPHDDKVSAATIEELGKKYGQESVVHHEAGKNRLKFVTGPNAGKFHAGEGLTMDPNLKENYTEILGQKFNLGLDFNKLHTPERLVHYSQHEGQMSHVDPAFMGNGRQGLESRRGDILPRSYYYEAGSQPEDIVSSSARNVHMVDRPEKVIDLNSDEAMPFRQAASDMNDLERKLKESGYAGYSNSHPENQVPNAVALFDKQPVVESKPFKRGEKYAAGGAVPMAAGGMAPSMPAPPPMDPIDAFLATPSPISGAGAPAQPSYVSPAPEGMDQFIQPEQVQQQYGGLGQQAIAGLEGAAQGLAGPLATGFETQILGVKPEDIRGREEANPATHLASEVAGFIGPALMSGGTSGGLRAGVGAVSQAGMLTRAGAAAEGLIGKQISNKLAKDSIREAFVGGLYQGGEEISKRFKEDPEQTAETAIANIGLSTVMSGVFGGAAGAAMRKAKGVVSGVPAPIGPMISQVDAPKMEAGDLATLVKHDLGFTQREKTNIITNFRDFLKQEKPNADAIRKVGHEHGLPVFEGMVSGNQLIQRAEDALLTGGNTFSAVKRQELYDKGYKGAESILNQAMGEGSNLTKAQVGEQLGTSLKSKIRSENAPIAEMYNALKQKTATIPLDESMVPGVMEDLQKVPEFRVTPKSPQGQLARRIMEDLENVKTVDDLKILKSSIHDSLPVTASAGEKRMAAILTDKLKQLEEDSIERFALESAVTAEDFAAAKALPAMRKEADKAYKPFINKVQALAKQLGKSRVHGAQDAINFIDNLDYEQVSSRLFNKNKSQFLDFFGKEFPAEMEMLRGYQKGLLREGAMRAGEFSALTFFNNFNKLEPEIQKSLFAVGDLKRIGDMETYLRSFPKRFNPSGTAAAMNLRNAFQPKQLGLLNAQDFAIEQFIKHAAASPEAHSAMELGKATVEGDRLANRAIKAMMSDKVHAIPAAVIPLAAHREKLAKLVTTYQANPEKMLEVGDNNPVPEYQTAFAQTMTRAVQYLTSVKPNNEPKQPLDERLPLSKTQTDEYNRVLEIAQQPLSIINHMAHGTMTPKDVQALQTIYPAVYRALAQKMMSAIMEKKEKGQEIDYVTRMQMSMFLAQPLDSTMTPAGIMNAQMKSAKNQPPTPTMPGSGAKHSLNGLGKMSKSYQTHMQARESSKLK